jgi:hypothetical protein
MRATSNFFLLSGESEQEYATLQARIVREVAPRDAIEELFVNDIVPVTRDITRINRNKTGLLRNAYPAALHSLLKQILHREEYMHHVMFEDPILEKAAKYFSDKKAKKAILAVLAQFGLDESALEAEAFRLVAYDLEGLDKMLSNAERRRYRLIKFIARYRKTLSIQLRQVTDKIISESELDHPVFSELP